MLKRPESTVAVITEESPDLARVMAMVNMEPLNPIAGTCGTADSTSAVMSDEQFLVGAARQPQATLEVVIGKSLWIGAISALVRLVQFIAVLARPRFVPSATTHLAHAIKPVMKVLVGPKFRIRLNGLATATPLSPWLRLHSWWTLPINSLPSAKTRLAPRHETINPLISFIELRQRLSLATRTASLHLDLLFNRGHSSNNFTLSLCGMPPQLGG